MSVSVARPRQRRNNSAGRSLECRGRGFLFFCVLTTSRVILIRHVPSCFVHEPQLRLLDDRVFHHTHRHRQFGSGCGDVPLAPLASHLAAMSRGLRHSKPIWFGAAWRDARRCGRSRVGWVGGSAIGLEDPAQVRDLRGFVGAFGSVRAARSGVDLIKSASAELPNAVYARVNS